MSETGKQSGGALSGIADTLKKNPAVSRLGEEARNYAVARAGHAVDNLTDRLNNGGGVKAALQGARGVAEGKSPARAGLSAGMTGLKEKVKGVFGGKGGGGGQLKMTNIEESIDIGLPVDVVYDQWTQFEEFPKFMKGVEGVERTDDAETTWRVKVFKSRRSWKANTKEMIPDRRIAWTSEGAKGSTKGVVTFHALADDLTRILLVMEYYPSGFFEKTGNLWRAQGRRVRLDLKHFRRFIMQEGEATGSWRGEIRDGEVVREPDEEENGEGREGAEEGEEEAGRGERGERGRSDEDRDRDEEEYEDEEDEYEDEDEGEEEDEDEDEGGYEDEEDEDEDEGQGGDEDEDEDEDYGDEDRDDDEADLDGDDESKSPAAARRAQGRQAPAARRSPRR